MQKKVLEPVNSKFTYAPKIEQSNIFIEIDQKVFGESTYSLADFINLLQDKNNNLELEPREKELLDMLLSGAPGCDIDRPIDSSIRIKNNQVKIKIIKSAEGEPISDWQVPPNNANYFIHRDEFYKPLTDYFKDNKEQHTIVVNAGLGGVGKTQLAVYYCHHAAKAYPLKCWFKASTRDGLIAEYREFCSSHHIMPSEPSPTAIIQAVRNWFSHSNRPHWLIIYDDALDQDMLQAFLPSKGGDIIITSRYQDWSNSYCKLSITVMTESEAIVLLKKSIDPANKLIFTEQNETELRTLAEQLGQLPLVLAQAGAYIHAAKGRVSIANYIVRFEKYRVKLLEDKKLPAGQNHEPITVTWRITLTAMQEKCPNAIKLLEALSFLDSSRIPQMLIEAWTKQVEPPWDELELEEALRTAIDYSMVQQNESGNETTYAMHNLVQLVVRSGLIEEHQRTCLMQWITCINQLFNEADEDKPLLVEQRESQLLAHNTSILDYVKKENCFDDKLEKAQFYGHISTIYFKLGYPQKQKALLEDVLVIQTVYYGRGHWQTASTLNNLALAYGALGDNQKKKELLEEVLSIQTAHYGRAHWQTASTLGNLANAYGDLGDRQRQKDLLDEVLGIHVAHYGRRHWQTAITLGDLANAYGDLGDRPEAKRPVGRRVKYSDGSLWSSALADGQHPWKSRQFLWYFRG